MNIVPADLGEVLGIDIASGKKEKVGGITPGKRSPYYVHAVTIRIGGYTFPNTEMGFMPDMPDYGYGVVGQCGFFDLFKITFDFQKERIELKPYTFN